MKNCLKKIWWIIVSLLAAWAPGFNWEIQRKLRPDAFEIGGYLHQAIGRTFDAVGTDHITMIVVILGVLWLTNRYLYHKPAGSGIGEYVLCAFFTVMQLLNTVTNQVDTVAMLYANMFQVIKTILYLPGVFVLFLCAVRALNELLQWNPAHKRCAWWDQHPFLFPVIVLCIAWLPHLIIKYPGALTIDTVLQYHQYALIRPRTTPHPPFGSVIYGWLIENALASGQMNLFYFGFTLAKTAVFIAVLAYSLAVMNRRRLPMWVCWFALTLYAISPVYVGWTTVISKDSSYLIMIMLCGALMLETMETIENFLRSKWRVALLTVSLSLLMLIRHNGITVALPVLAVMVFRLIREKGGKKAVQRLICVACAVLLLGVGIEETIIYTMDIERAGQDDFLAIPMMQTARIAYMHGKELSQKERDTIDHVFDIDRIKQRYDPDDSDSIRYSAPEGRTDDDLRVFLGQWLKLVQRYPVTALDATLHMNGVLFDLQDNNPIYVGLTDHTLTDDVYLHSFNDMTYYNREAILPLNGLQRALTEWYYRFDDLPLIGGFASMGFCMILMMIVCYLCVVNRRKGMLLIMLPAVVAGITGIFCPVVYSRYLLPMMGGVPIWLAGWWISVQNEEMQKGVE